jgi:uncharacterized metal-binding protein YceD (DUF177 family)
MILHSSTEGPIKTVSVEHFSFEKKNVHKKENDRRTTADSGLSLALHIKTALRLECQRTPRDNR